MSRLLEWAKAVILNPPLMTARLLIAVVSTLLVTLIRWVLDTGTFGFPLSLHIPVIVICAALYGWQAGLTASLTAALSIGILILPYSITGRVGGAELFFLTSLTLAAATIIAMTETLRHMVFALDRQRHEVRLLNRELQHRSKNALQMLLSVIERGLRHDDPRPYFAPLPARLVAWARAIELLRPEAEVSCSLDELTATALEAFEIERIERSQDDVRIDHAAAAPLVLALHELATNSTKYGALSSPAGRVSITWTESSEHIELVWRERGGPAVSEPTRRGMGTALLQPRDGLEDLIWLFRPEGVVAMMTLRKPQ